MARVKRNDMVIVLSGKDRGKKGVVLKVDSEKNRIMVKGAGIVIKHVKARRQGEVSGIKKEESWLVLSKVMPLCSACKKPCRVNALFLEDGKKVRTCNRCKEII